MDVVLIHLPALFCVFVVFLMFMALQRTKRKTLYNAERYIKNEMDLNWISSENFEVQSTMESPGF